MIGDSGTGERGQYEVGERMAEYHARFPFEFVLMLGDNIYGREKPEDYAKKFERPYRALLDAGVEFYAALGNHDEPVQRFYEPFNMGGRPYYSFKTPRGEVRFFALESGYVDDAQIAWLEQALREARETWKIGFFHHPLYSSGRRHGPAEEVRELLEPLFVEHGVDVVFAGHEHFYERLKPQQGILYFTSGGAGKLRRSNITRATPEYARGFDQDHHFMLVEITGDELHFQAVSRAGSTIDSGVFRRGDRSVSVNHDRIAVPRP